MGSWTSTGIVLIYPEDRGAGEGCCVAPARARGPSGLGAFGVTSSKPHQVMRPEQVLGLNRAVLVPRNPLLTGSAFMAGPDTVPNACAANADFPCQPLTFVR